MAEFTFYCPALKQAKLNKEDLNDPVLLAGMGGRWVWTALTVYYLKQTGASVCLSHCLPKMGVVFFHANDRKQLLSEKPDFASLSIICLAADAKKRQRYAAAHIFQNPRQVLKGHDFHISHWPLPIIKSRSGKRADTIAIVAYKGHSSYLPSRQRELLVECLKKSILS